MLLTNRIENSLTAGSTATSQASESSDTVPSSAPGTLSVLWNHRATTGILG
jgi:hypothetical protein